MAHQAGRGRGNSSRQRGPLVVHAHDDPRSQQVGPAERLQQRIKALDEENQTLARSISNLRRSKPSQAPRAVRGAPIVVAAFPNPALPTGPAGMPAPRLRGFIPQPQMHRARSLSPVGSLSAPSAVIALPTPFLHPIASLPSSPVISRAASPVPSQATSRSPSPRSMQSVAMSAPTMPTLMTPTKHPSQGSSSVRKASLTRTANLPSAISSARGTASEVSPTPIEETEAMKASAAARAALLQQAARQTTGFADVYNELLGSAMEAMQARAVAAVRERERDEATAAAQQLRASNARLEHAIARKQAQEASTARHSVVHVPCMQGARQLPGRILRPEPTHSPEASDARAALVLRERSLQLDEDFRIELERQQELNRQHDLDMSRETERLAVREEDRQRRLSMQEQQLHDLAPALPEEQKPQVPNQNLNNEASDPLQQLKQLQHLQHEHHEHQMQQIRQQKRQIQQLRQMRNDQDPNSSLDLESNCSVQTIVMKGAEGQVQPRDVSRMSSITGRLSSASAGPGKLKNRPTGLAAKQTASPPQTQRLVRPLSPAPVMSDAQSEAYKEGWRLFHQQLGSVADNEAAQAKASEVMLRMKQGLPVEGVNSATNTIWRQALLEGAAKAKSKPAASAQRSYWQSWSLFGEETDSDEG